MGVYVNNGTIRADGSYVVSSDGMVVTFTPAMPFPTNSLVYVFSNIDSSITDFANNVLQYTYSTFTTASAPADTTAPTVVAVTPNDGTSEVGSLATITLTFSESMNTVAAFPRIGLFAGGVPQSASLGWSADNRMAVLSGNWPLNTVMTVVATADNTDLAGNHLAPFSSTFRTASTFDPNRPYVVTQLPTGLVVECQDSRSQHKNREKALGVLAARIKDRREREIAAKTASTRKSLIGSGDRSERIRTYNFPQGRVTDHRINLTLYKIERILDGEMDELIAGLVAADQAERLAQLAEETP